jgi:hypothetical protein
VAFGHAGGGKFKGVDAEHHDAGDHLVVARSVALTATPAGA